MYTFFFLLMFTNGYLLASDPNQPKKPDYLSILPEEIKTEILNKITNPGECIKTISSLQIVNKTLNTFVKKTPIQKMLEMHEITIYLESIRKKHSDAKEFIKEIIVLRKNNKTFKKIFSRYKRMQYELANEFIKACRYPLHEAASIGFAEVVNALLQSDNKGLLVQKIDVNKTNVFGDTPLILAAFYGHTETVKALLAHKKINENKADSAGKTPLFWAKCNGHIDIVELLKEK